MEMVSLERQRKPGCISCLVHSATVWEPQTRAQSPCLGSSALQAVALFLEISVACLGSCPGAFSSSEPPRLLL